MKKVKYIGVNNSCHKIGDIYDLYPVKNRAQKDYSTNPAVGVFFCRNDVANKEKEPTHHIYQDDIGIRYIILADKLNPLIKVI